VNGIRVSDGWDWNSDGQERRMRQKPYLEGGVKNMAKLQVALDVLKVEDALRIATQVHPFVDHIECGTPLIKSVGMHAVELMKDKFSQHKIVADLKTLDTGFLEAKLAFTHGADFVVVAGAAPLETLFGALEAKAKYGKGIIVDLIGTDPLLKAKEFHQLGIDTDIDFLEFHLGIDQQKGAPFEVILKQIQALKEHTNIKLAIAGGLNETTAPKAAVYADLIIVGSAITRAPEPAEAALRIRRALNRESD